VSHTGNTPAFKNW